MDLTDLVDGLKRAVATPGDFDTYFPNAATSDLIGLLMDGMAEAQMDGLLGTITLDVSDGSTDVDLVPGQQALVVLYARARLLSAQIANLRNRVRYAAGGGIEYETEQSASVLVQLLKDTQARKAQILADAQSGAAGTDFAMVDLYVTKSLDFSSADLGYCASAWV